MIPTDFIFLFIIWVGFLWSELIRVQFYFIFTFLFDPSWSDPDWRSELIRSDFCTCLLRSEGLWGSLLCPMKMINKICFTAHLSNYWKCKNNYLFFPAENILPSLQNLRCDADQVRNKTNLPSNLRTVAAKEGFLVSDNQASGNCLFYALSEQLKSVKGIQISHKELRNTLVQFLRENANQVRRLNFIMLEKKMAEAFSVSY